MAKRRNIVVSLLLSIITCGFYGLYWWIKVTNELNFLSGTKNGTSGLMVIIYSIITCGIYGLYWAYKMGEKVEIIKGHPGGNTGILYLLLYFFGLVLVDLALMQDTINDKLDYLC